MANCTSWLFMSSVISYPMVGLPLGRCTMIIFTMVNGSVVHVPWYARLQKKYQGGELTIVTIYHGILAQVGKNTL